MRLITFFYFGLELNQFLCLASRYQGCEFRSRFRCEFRIFWFADFVFPGMTDTCAYMSMAAVCWDFELIDQNQNRCILQSVPVYLRSFQQLVCSKVSFTLTFVPAAWFHSNQLYIWSLFLTITYEIFTILALSLGGKFSPWNWYDDDSLIRLEI